VDWLPSCDEIDTLAEVFQIMIGKAASARKTQAVQVADPGKSRSIIPSAMSRSRKLSKTTFQSLQSKAYEMRSRRSQAKKPKRDHKANFEAIIRNPSFRPPAVTFRRRFTIFSAMRQTRSA